MKTVVVLGVPVGSECVYYNRKGQLLSLFQLCFDINRQAREQVERLR